MTLESSRIVRGYIGEFSIRRVLDQGAARFDVEISLSSERQGGSSKTVVRFTDARNIRVAGSRDGIDPGAHLSLAIEDVSKDRSDGVRYKAHAGEDGGLSLDCLGYDVEEVAAVSLPQHCRVLF